MSELLKLAERCEQANGPSAELDALIRCALFAPPGAYVEQSRINDAWCVYSGTYSQGGAPRLFERPRNVPFEAWQGSYTASLDAAMTLVPEGWDWAAGTEQNGGGGHAYMRHAQTRTRESESDAATPALALCAAALRARAAGGEA